MSYMPDMPDVPDDEQQPHHYGYITEIEVTATLLMMLCLFTDVQNIYIDDCPQRHTTVFYGMAFETDGARLEFVVPVPFDDILKLAGKIS